MKHAAAVLVLAFGSITSLTAEQNSADESDIVKGLQNLSSVHRIANVLELRRTLAHSLPLQVPADPWGTPYRISESPAGYRIVSAGGDAKFDETVALARQQFAGIEGDIVFEDGKLIRSNRNWLYARVRVEVTPGERFAHMIETLFGLARLGHVDAKGMPNPLQLALTAREFRDVFVLRSPPPAVQRALFGMLAPVARWRGYRATYPQLSRTVLAPRA
jgi:hypothetical protein